MKKALLSSVYFFACIFSIQAQVLYGTTTAGGSEGAGTIIRFTPAGNNVTVLKSFKNSELANGVSPTGSLLLATNGKLYGLTHFGGSTNQGVIFSYDLSTGIYTKLHDFDGPNGAHPAGNLIQASNGLLYGMTQDGTVSSVIFSFDPVSLTFTNLKVFDRPTGEEPLGSLVQASNGKLYGLTSNGGSANGGVVFSFDPLTATYTKLHDFDGDDGGGPFGDLLQAKNGKLYGMTQSGGVGGFGVIFSFDPVSLTFAKLKDFDQTDGGSPQNSLIQLADGKLYGMTTNGGDFLGDGVIFSYDISSSAYTVLKRFDNINGARPGSNFLQASDGKLYATTETGGSNNLGVIFSFIPASSTFTKLKDFENTNGAGPSFGSSFIQGPNANIPSLVLTPETGTASINTNRCFDALLKDQSNNPLVGVRVDFKITGANPGSTGFVNTNSSGIAHFCYTGLNPGTDSIVASQGSIEDASTFMWTADYYSKATGDLHNLLTWGLNPNGSGTNPPNFIAGKIFHLANRGSAYNLTGDWMVGGILDIPGTSQLHINQFMLNIANLAGTGTLYGLLSSDLIVAGNTGGEVGPLNFANGGGFLNNLTLNRVGPSAMATINSPIKIQGALSVMNGTLNTGNNITLMSNVGSTARVTKVGGVISGFVTIERYIPARRAWRIMSAPIASYQSIYSAWQEGASTHSSNPNPHPGFGTHITEGTATYGFDHNPLTAMVSIKKYTSASDTWVPLLNTNATSVNSNAYLLFIRGDRGVPLGLNTVPPTSTTLRVTGQLNTGDQTFPVSATGFTAIPNPYACPINFKTITRISVPDNFYLWDPRLGGATGVGGYVLLSANGSGGYDITPAPVSPESQFIQSGQGFLVHASGTGASIIIKESDKSANGSNSVFRAANPASGESPISVTKGLRASLQIVEEDKTTSVLDETLTSYSPAFSDKVDDMDPVKLPNINENLGLIRDGQSLMIERRKEFTGNDTINLQLWNAAPRNYLLQLSPENLASSAIVSGYLEDKYLHISTPVSINEVTKVYFSIDGNAASADKDRFRIVLSGKGAAPADIVAAKSAIRLFSNPIKDNTISLQFISQPEGAYKVTLFNNIGQEVYRGKIMHGGGSALQTLQFTNRIAKGVYQLHVTNAKDKIISGISVLIN